MKQIFNTSAGPAPIGPYNQSVIFNNLIFVSGQIALDPVSGALVLDDIETETHRVLQNVQGILEAAGSGLDKVIKSSVFVKDMNQFGRINAVYGTYFAAATAPARELVQVAELPKFVNVEISVIAHL